MLVGLFMLLMTHSAWSNSDLPQASESQSPARIELVDQSVIYGEITDIHDGELHVSTVWMGEVTIALSSIAQLQSDQEIEVLTIQQERLALSSLQVVDGKVVLKNTENLTLDQLDVANPEDWERGRGYKITGRTTSEIEYNRGNTETNQLNLDFEAILESRRDRITVHSDYEKQSSIIRSTGSGGELITDTQTTADNWQVVGKYDYFLSDSRNYLGVNLGFSADRFADLESRFYVGPYYGRKILSRDTLKFDAELGISYVETDFTLAEDDSYTGVNINLTGEAQLFDSMLTLYFRQVNIVNLSSVERSIYRTKVGMRFPLFLGFEAAAEASADYDGGAAEGKEKLDETLTFRLGYTW